MNEQDNAILPSTIDVYNVDNLNHDNAEDRDFTEVNSRRKGKCRKITVIGDSILKHLEAHKMQKVLKPNQKIYVKSFPGAVTSDFTDYIKPSQKFSPDLYVIHSGSNDLRSSKTPEQISNEILELATNIKTENDDVIISGITTRNDQYNEKGKKVNNLLKSKCVTFSFVFVDNLNIKSKHLNGSGLHLNYSGTVMLANNLLKAIDI